MEKGPRTRKPRRWPRWFHGYRYGTVQYWRRIGWSPWTKKLFNAEERAWARKKWNDEYEYMHALYADGPGGALMRTLHRKYGINRRLRDTRWDYKAAKAIRTPRVKDDRDELDHAYAASPWLWLTGGRDMLALDDPLRQHIILPVWTLDEHAEVGEEKKNWPDTLYLQVLIELFRNFPKKAVWKSRKMLATWAAIGENLHYAQYSVGRELLFQCKTEEESVQRLLKRAWYIYDHQPNWLKARHPARLVGNRMEFLGTDVRITAIQEGDRAWRAPTVSRGIIDEIAHMDGVDDIVSAAFAAISGVKHQGSLTMLSTPNGREKFYRLVHDIEGKPLTPEQEAITGSLKAHEGCPGKGMSWRMNSNGVLAVFLHYSADLDRDPCFEAGKTWCTRTFESYIGDEGRRRREFELSADIAAGTPVYATAFDEDVVVSSTAVYQVGKTAFEGWDFGFHHPAYVAGYMNDLDQLVILYEVIGNQTLIHEFGAEMKRRYRLTGEMKEAPRWVAYGDPAGAQRSDKSQKSSIEVLHGLGINVGFRRTSIQDGLVTIRKLLRPREDKRPGLVIHARCRNLIDAMKGGYHYPETKPDEPDRESEVPYKDGWYEHVCDALRYLAINVARPTGDVVAAKKPRTSRKRRSVNPRTGY